MLLSQRELICFSQKSIVSTVYLPTINLPKELVYYAEISWKEREGGDRASREERTTWARCVYEKDV